MSNTGATRSNVIELPDQRQLFKESMAAFPSGVTIVTTTDAEGRWWGFTATSFSSVSMDPPLVLVCLADTATCHPAFLAADQWIVHVVPDRHEDLAMKFASRGADKFAGTDFVVSDEGLPLLPDAYVALTCSAHAKYQAGDHTILVGEVLSSRVGEGEPTVYFRRQFRSVA